MAPRKPASPKAPKPLKLKIPKGIPMPKGNNKEPKALTPQMKNFVEQYIIDFNGKRAAIDAGYSPKTAQEQGSRLLSYPIIEKAVAKAIEARNKRTHRTQDRVLNEVWHIAMSNANNLIQYRRTCCRYCYGEFNRYQRTAGEMERDEIEHEAAIIKADTEGVKLTEKQRTFDRQGGIGFDPRKDPNPDCGECFGEGYGSAHIMDTRKLAPEDLAAYAGVKITKDGIQVLMHDKATHIDKLMRHMNLMDPKLTLKGDPENPLTMLIQQMQGSALPVAGPEPDED
jgi:hypothetical protein